jgi:hypothetical protein
MKQLAIVCFLLAGSICHAQLQVSMNGSAVQYGKQLEHIDGKPVTVVTMVLQSRNMNQGSNLQPIGLWIFNSFTLAEHANYCGKWFARVSTLEKTAREQMRQGQELKVYPYLQFSVVSGAQRVQTDEGDNVWRGTDVQCWETEDFLVNDFTD